MPYTYIMFGILIIFPVLLIAFAAPFMVLVMLGFSIIKNKRVGAFNVLLKSFIRSIYCTVAFCALALYGEGSSEQMLDMITGLTVFAASFTLCSLWLWVTVGLKQPEQGQI
jgi:hypothetical protein